MVLKKMFVLDESAFSLLPPITHRKILKIKVRSFESEYLRNRYVKVIVQRDGRIEIIKCLKLNETKPI